MKHSNTIPPAKRFCAVNGKSPHFAAPAVPPAVPQPSTSSNNYGVDDDDEMDMLMTQPDFLRNIDSLAAQLLEENAGSPVHEFAQLRTGLSITEFSAPFDSQRVPVQSEKVGAENYYSNSAVENGRLIKELEQMRKDVERCKSELRRRDGEAKLLRENKVQLEKQLAESKFSSSYEAEALRVQIRQKDAENQSHMHKLEAQKHFLENENRDLLENLNSKRRELSLLKDDQMFAKPSQPKPKLEKNNSSQQQQTFRESSSEAKFAFPNSDVNEFVQTEAARLPINLVTERCDDDYLTLASGFRLCDIDSGLAGDDGVEEAVSFGCSTSNAFSLDSNSIDYEFREAAPLDSFLKLEFLKSLQSEAQTKGSSCNEDLGDLGLVSRSNSLFKDRKSYAAVTGSYDLPLKVSIALQTSLTFVKRYKESAKRYLDERYSVDVSLVASETSVVTFSALDTESCSQVLFTPMETGSETQVTNHSMPSSVLSATSKKQSHVTLIAELERQTPALCAELRRLQQLLTSKRVVNLMFLLNEPVLDSAAKSQQDSVQSMTDATTSTDNERTVLSSSASFESQTVIRGIVELLFTVCQLDQIVAGSMQILCYVIDIVAAILQASDCLQSKCIVRLLIDLGPLTRISDFVCPERDFILFSTMNILLAVFCPEQLDLNPKLIGHGSEICLFNRICAAVLKFATSLHSELLLYHLARVVQIVRKLLLTRSGRQFLWSVNCPCHYSLMSCLTHRLRLTLSEPGVIDYKSLLSADCFFKDNLVLLVTLLCNRSEALLPCLAVSDIPQLLRSLLRLLQRDRNDCRNIVLKALKHFRLCAGVSKELSSKSC